MRNASGFSSLAAKNLSVPRHAEPAICSAEHRSPAPRATASQRSTISLRSVAIIAISSLCSAAGTSYLLRASERWPTTMLNLASVIPSPACTVFAGRLITLHGPPVTAPQVLVLLFKHLALVRAHSD